MMSCPGCGALDDHGCRPDCPELRLAQRQHREYLAASLEEEPVSETPTASVFISDAGEVRVLPPGERRSPLRELRMDPRRRASDWETVPCAVTVFSPLPAGPACQAILRLVAEREDRDALLDECYAQLRGLGDAPYQPWPEALCQLFDALLRRHWHRGRPR